MNIKKKRFPLLIAFLTITQVIFAQEVGSNSPYGRYGFGVLSNPSLGASEAMGGISYGLRRSQQVNPGNPASYSELDSLTFIFDLGVSGCYCTKHLLLIYIKKRTIANLYPNYWMLTCFMSYS